MTDQTNPAAPQTVGARRVIEESVAQISQALSDLTGQSMEALAARGNTEPCRIARSALALKALLSAPEGAGTRLAEAAEKAAWWRGCKPVDMSTAMRNDMIALHNALADFRASPGAVGGFRYPETVARVNAALDDERAKTEAALRELAEERAAHAETRKTLERAEKLLYQNSAHADRENLEIIEMVGPLGPRSIMQAIRDCAKARDETTAALVQENQERIALAEERDALRAERDRLAGDPRTELRWGLFGTLSGPPELLTAYRYEAAAKVREVEANRGGGRAYIFDFGAATDGPGANPKPAPAEAPREAASGVSERARLIYEGAIALAAADQGEALAGHRQSAAFYAEQAVWIFRAAEAEAAKGGAA